MKILSLNVRGFGVAGKFSWVKELCFNEKPDIAVFQETKCRNLNDFWVNCVVGGDFFLAIRGNWVGSGHDTILVNVYGPHNDVDKKKMWDDLDKLMAGVDSGWVLCGDFNEVRTGLDRVNCVFHKARARRFNEFIVRNNLIEIPINGRKFMRISDDDFGHKPFKIFDEWLNRDGIDSVISEGWNKEVRGFRKDCIFRDKLKNVKTELRGWSKKEFGELDEEILTLKNIAHNWELKAESGTLSENDRMCWLESRKKWLAKEKIKVGMLRKSKKIFVTTLRRYLAQIRPAGSGGTFRVTMASNGGPGLSDGPVTADTSGLFTVPVSLQDQGAVGPGQLNSDGPAQAVTWPDLLHISHENANMLESVFTENEVWDAIKGCGSTKAPGPDGFNLRFYKKYWQDIKDDLMQAIEVFWSSGRISNGCNASFITLVPKRQDPSVLNDYRPISLIGSYYKIIAKLLSNRLRKVIPNLVGFEQSAFIKGRNILDGALIANETFNFLKHYRLKSLIFKVDFEKAFDCLNWDYLMEIMEIMGFGSKWRGWILSCLKSASVSILVNGSPTSEFKLERGVRQGDPLSPFLFIIAAEGLNVLTKRAVLTKRFLGVEIGSEKILISHLQYADDTIFFGEWSILNLRNLFKLLKCFELSSGLKVNYLKSTLYGVGIEEAEINKMASLFGCKSSSFPFTYLGLPVGGKMNKLESWNPVLDKFSKILSDWKARTVSYGGCLTLVKSVLNSLPLFKTKTNDLWVKVISSIYGSSGGLLGPFDNNVIPYNSVWTNIIKAGSSIDELGISFRNSFIRKVGNGNTTSFWNDLWVGNVEFKNRFKRLAHLETNLEASVGSRVLGNGAEQRFNGSWIREPSGRAKGELEELQGLLRSVTLQSDKPDSWCWNMCNSGIFKTKILAEHIDSKILHVNSSSSSGTIRNSLVPKKVEVFIWRVLKGRIPVLIELDKRGVDLNSVRCPTCDNDIENINHFILSCDKTRDVWAKIFDWWTVPRPQNLTVRSLVDGSTGSLGSDVGRDVWQARDPPGAAYMALQTPGMGHLWAFLDGCLSSKNVEERGHGSNVSCCDW
ncbi:uncharacterized protein [Rutidosis leptorrhynchoides]|uniref:uncharacterized protein n=1 Tax=Rutidosis leptorrhynchoides TaxID=125765 RepID=UPI003A991E6A